MRDLVYAFRILRKAPGLSLVIVLSLAVGIGTNTAVFSWLNTAILRPLSGITADVACLEARNPAGVYPGSSWLEYRDLVERLPSLAGIIAQRPRTFYLGDSERGERVWGELVSGNFFQVLGVSATFGRFFRPDEAATPGGAPVVVISHRFWQHYFAAAPDVVGRTVKLNNRTLTVIGVAAPDFIGAINGLGFDVWVPLTMASELIPATRELTERDNRSYLLLGALRPGVSRAQVDLELANVARTLATEFPETNEGVQFEMLPVWRDPRAGLIISGALATLQMFAALILVVVCVNTANLLLARASVRQREIGIRLACGAGGGRIVRQLLTESVLLGLLGTALGVLVAVWGIDFMRQIPVPTDLPIRFAIEFDWHALAFTTVVGLVCGLLFGLAPALQLARGDIQNALRGGQGSIGGHSRLRDVLIAAEVAVALVVLVLAGLFLKSFINARTIDPGFKADRVLLGSVDLLGRGYERARARAFIRDVTARLASIPGVATASAASAVPLDIRGISKRRITIDGAPRLPGKDPQALLFVATPGYFETLGIPLLEGTDLTPLDQEKRVPDAVINQEMARRFWPGISPLGHRFHYDDKDYEVVGVVRNAKYENLAERPQPVAWLTARSRTLLTPTFFVRVQTGEPLALLPLVRDTVRALDPELAVYDGRPLRQHIENTLFIQRTPAQMLGVLGPLALALSAIGLYAVLAYSLAQRTQEIGIRLTLGATPASVVALLARQAMRVVMIGAVIGWICAFAVGYQLRTHLVAVPLGDPLIFTGVPALLLAVALLACWLPARRATKVDPLVALRTE